MKLNSLEIKNFRGFKSYKISFTPRTSIIIGRNGAGKSTLIDALKIALSFIFSSNKKLGKDFLSAGNPSLNVNSFTDSDYHYDSESGTTAPDASVIGKAYYNGQQLNWELYKRSTANAALYSTKYQKAFDQFMHEWKVNAADLPLVACFSDSFPHKPTQQTQFAIDSIRKDRIPRNFGYYQWDLETACTSIWETRLCNQLARIAPLYTRASRVASSIEELEGKYTAEQLVNNVNYQNAKNEQERINALFNPIHEEIEYVQSRLVQFSQKLPKLWEEQYYIDYLAVATTGEELELNFVFKNGKSKLLNNLPAGYCRLYSIILDLAYRAYILNGVKEPAGIVLIDEIDLHLHPSMEQDVVQCLRDVFPLVQFIITSHSAAAIANLDTTEKVEDEETGDLTPANQLVFMQEGQTEGEVLPIIYGVDYNAALRDFMGSPSRNEDLRKKGDEYLNYCSMGLEQEARTIIGELTQSLGTEHPFVKELQDKAKAYEVH